MIVLSILTALLLEHAAVWSQNRIDAAASRVRIEAELARNALELKNAEQVNRQSNTATTALLRALVEHLKAGKPVDPQIEQQLKTVFDHFQIELPTFQRSAWDSAIADQTASHLPEADLRRYSEIYATAADVATTAQVLLGGEWLSQGAQVLLDSRLGKIDNRGLAQLLVRFLLAEQPILASEEALSGLIEGHPQTQSVENK